MEMVMRHRPFVLVCLFLIGIVSFFLARVVGTDFFPTADVGILKLHFRAPIGTRIEETEKIVLRCRGRDPQIDSRCGAGHHQ